MSKFFWLVLPLIVALLFFFLYRYQRGSDDLQDGLLSVELNSTSSITFSEQDGQILVSLALDEQLAKEADAAALYPGDCSTATRAPLWILAPHESGVSETVLAIARPALAANSPLSLKLLNEEGLITSTLLCRELIFE